MKTQPNNSISKRIISAIAVTAPLSASTVVIDHIFDGVANDIGPAFQQVANGLGDGSSSLSTGVINSGNSLSPSGPNGSFGFNTTAPVNVLTSDPSATGFQITFFVSGTGGFDVSDLTFNGLFLGIVSGTNSNGTAGSGLWNNDPHAFGYVAGSGTASGNGYGDHVIRQDAQTGGNTNSVNNTPLTTIAPTDSSLQDGLTLTLGLYDDDTWTISSTGLSTNLADSGSLDTGIFGYAGFAAAATPYLSLQGVESGTITVDRITLTAIPEPSSALLLGVSGILFLARRKRS